MYLCCLVAMIYKLQPPDASNIIAHKATGRNSDFMHVPIYYNPIYGKPTWLAGMCINTCFVNSHTQKHVVINATDVNK